MLSLAWKFHCQHSPRNSDTRCLGTSVKRVHMCGHWCRLLFLFFVVACLGFVFDSDDIVTGLYFSRSAMDIIKQDQVYLLMVHTNPKICMWIYVSASLNHSRSNHANAIRVSVVILKTWVCQPTCIIGSSWKLQIPITHIESRDDMRLHDFNPVTSPILLATIFFPHIFLFMLSVSVQCIVYRATLYAAFIIIFSSFCFPFW